ncbi:hypothetical protein IY40_25115 [Serratia marcescens]|uniref:hypothetical protein n=1 Tax=Serratia marcescens TaxID=615 RepID=UPI0004E6E186|nr:hypothetical protein [Serratia marcescens]KFF76272.1 hypothetical protein IY40_25115 [Serratia marcescens]
MEKAILSGTLQLEILDYLFANHPNTLTWPEFVAQFGELDDPSLIINIRQLMTDRLVTPKAIILSAGEERIAVSKLKLTAEGYQFIAHNPPRHKY